MSQGTALDRFWRKVDRDGPPPRHRPELGRCWLWTGTRSVHGYGRFNSVRPPMQAHRFAYETLVGPVPEGLELDHLCSNPPCVNPSHLEPVTHEENVRRALGPDVVSDLSRCPSGHLYADHAWFDKRGRKKCRVCISDVQRRRRAKVRADQSPDQLPFVCECGERFATAIGRGQHRRHQHWEDVTDE